MRLINLNKGWKVRSEGLDHGVEMAGAVNCRDKGWMEADLPCDVHMPLIKNGIISEPLTGLNFKKCEWIEERSWWFRNEFDAGEETLSADTAELTLESLDAEADIFINGNYLGHQKSAFYPFCSNVAKKLKKGKNVILIRLTCGLERFSENDISILKKQINATLTGRRTYGDKRRAYVRKPQYVYGWDWAPRNATCGIMKDAYIKICRKLAVRHVRTATETISAESGEARVTFDVEVENLHPFATFEGGAGIEISFKNRKIVALEKNEILMCSGINHIQFSAVIPKAKLWWPNGAGDQPLYTAKVTAWAVEEDDAEGADTITVNGTDSKSGTGTEARHDSSADEGLKRSPEKGVNGSIRKYTNEYGPFRFGIRTVSLDISKISPQSKNRRFAFIINGVRIFSKGGNWVPADSLYARVTDKKYRALIREAVEANFNMLRVWGGGIYERDIFYELCDEYGIMVWQEFMFACSMYPDHLEWFRTEVHNEIDYQTRHLGNHACIVLFSGNNENHWGFDSWWLSDPKPDFKGGAYIYNIMAPGIVRVNCPSIPYWNGSPYGGDRPNDPEIGDRHNWDNVHCIKDDEIEKRVSPEEYDRETSGFVSEFGYIGPPVKNSVMKYYPSKDGDENADVNAVDMSGETWHWHTGTFENRWETVVAGIRKHYIDTKNIDLDKYIYYGSLCQGLILGYAFESMRFRADCNGAIFWMFSDCWGEVGWTIVDYYLARKPSYYYVKRALAPARLIMREKSGDVTVVLANDKPDTINLNLEYGYVTFTGVKKDTGSATVCAKPFTRTVAAVFKEGGHDIRNGCYYAKVLSCRSAGKGTEGKRAEGGEQALESNQYDIQPAILRSCEFRKLDLPHAELSISGIRQEGDMVSLTVSGNKFAHAVHFVSDVDITPSDNYFDLLPGEKREILITTEGTSLRPDMIRAEFVVPEGKKK